MGPTPWYLLFLVSSFRPISYPPPWFNCFLFGLLAWAGGVVTLMLFVFCTGRRSPPVFSAVFCSACPRRLWVGQELLMRQRRLVFATHPIWG